MLMPLVVSKNIVSSIREMGAETIYRPQRWRQRIAAFGWYDWARFSLEGDRSWLEQWFFERLGWHAVRHDPTGFGDPIFEGMIWMMVLHLPGMTLSLSLDDVWNEVLVRYEDTNFTPNPPTTSGTAVTSAISNTDSVALYGTKQIVLQRGRLNSTMANKERLMWLNEYAFPKPTKKVSDSDRLKLDVTIKGYWHTLDWKTRQQTTDTGLRNASAEVDDIIQEDAEFIANSLVDTNTLQVPQYWNREDEVRTLRDIIEWIASQGDAGDDRWIAGVKAGRIFIYQESEKRVLYHRSISDPSHAIRHVQRGEIIEPWNVRPDCFIRTTDVNPLGSALAGTLEKDPQVNYIEAVEWSEPYGLILEDSRAQRIEALMARHVAKGEEIFRREFA